MKVTNRLGNLSVSSKDGQGCAILSNGKGGFAMLSPKPSSRYVGFFAMHRPGEVYRFIESIDHSDPIIEVTNKLSDVERKRRSFTESLFMPAGFNAFLYSAGNQVDVRLVLDCKHAYDNREWGRHYNIEPLPQGLGDRLPSILHQDLARGAEVRGVYVYGEHLPVGQGAHGLYSNL